MPMEKTTLFYEKENAKYLLAKSNYVQEINTYRTTSHQKCGKNYNES